MGLVHGACYEFLLGLPCLQWCPCARSGPLVHKASMHEPWPLKPPCTNPGPKSPHARTLAPKAPMHEP